MKEIGKSFILREKKEGFLKRNLPHLKTLVLIVIVGVVLGTQIYNPNKRTIEAIAGLLLLFSLLHLVGNIQ